MVNIGIDGIICPNCGTDIKIIDIIVLGIQYCFRCGEPFYDKSREVLDGQQ